MATCRGIDVSAYQAAQDWAAHKRNGVVFAFAKASEGMRSRDSRFVSHITAIKAAGLIPGAYHFGWPNQDVNAEAANYITAVKPYAGKGFVHWLDLERYSDGRNYAGRSAAQINTWVSRWLQLVQAAFPGQKVGVYTSGSDLQAGHVPAGVPLWYPAYPGTRVDTYAEAEAAAQPRPSGRAPLIWQFTSDPAGDAPRLDLNLCYLSAAELRAWAAGTTTKEEDVALSTDDVKKVWLTDGLVPVPADWSPGNEEWKPASILIDTGKRVRNLEKQLAVQNAAVTELTKTVAALAANTAAIDPDALVARIQGAIESVTVHLDVPETPTP